jgi:hypothetical protein
MRINLSTTFNMQRNLLSWMMLAVLVLAVGSCQQPQKTEAAMEKDYHGIIPGGDAFTPVSAENLTARLNSYAPFDLTSDISHLTDREKQIVAILYDVAGIMDELFWMQSLGPKDVFLAKISDPELKKFAGINYGPWDRLGGNEPFVSQAGPKPAGANFYPADMTKEEFEALADTNKNSLYTIMQNSCRKPPA